jgi:hypothetical protein
MTLQANNGYYLPSSKLLQKPNVAVKEQLNVIDPVLEDRDPVRAHSECEAGNFLRVIAVVFHELEHIRVHHAAA